MEIIEQVINNFKPQIIIGVILIVLGIIVPVFKLYWLIAGVNTTPKEKLEKMDLKYLGRIFGIFITVIGLLLIIIPFVLSYFNMITYVRTLTLIIELSMLVLMLVYFRLKRNKIYNK